MRPVTFVSALATAAALAGGAGPSLHFDAAPPPPRESRADPQRETPPEDWMLATRLSGDPITSAQLRRARRQADELALATAREAPGLALVPWSFLGPQVIGGRIVDMAVHPLVADTVYVAAASGGIWKSTDAGATFKQACPNRLTQAIGALAIAPNGTLYVGTGESNPGGGSLTFGGNGVYRSTDDGLNWYPMGLGGSDRISRIAIDPADASRVFVAATGPLFAPGGKRGVYRSLDSGATWTLVLPGDNPTTGASDVRIDPLDPSRVYAVMWDHLRVPEVRRYGGPGSGVYRSTDGGSSWTRLAGGLPSPGPDVGRIGLGLAPSDPQRLYAIYSNTEGLFSGFYASTDGGSTWTLLPASGPLPGSQSTYAWWFARIWVDPANPQHVFVAGVPLVESQNGGLSWTSQSSFHADQHAMAWDPLSPGRVYVGNDGGVYRSQANGQPPWTFASVQPFTQFYTLDVGEQDPSRIVGGAQDNGCNRSYTTANPAQWNTYACADGLEALISFENQAVVYGCSQYGSCVRSVNGGDSSSSIGSTTSARRNWLTPLVFDPSDADVMYYAGNIVNRSINGGVSWTAISPDLTGGDPFPGDAYPFGTVTTVAAARSNPLVLYAGTDDGRVWHTATGGAPWSQSLDPDLPNRWVTRIVVDPNDAAVAWVSFSGFRNADATPYVLKTVDGGVNWTDITGRLPQAPVNALAVAGTTLVAATDVGVWVLVNGEWFYLGAGLPRVPVTDVRYHAGSNQVYVSTFGRGMWSVPLPSSLAARR